MVRRTTLCGAPPHYSLDIRFGGSGTAYSKAAHIPVRRAGATPLSLKVHPLCLQYAELPVGPPLPGEGGCGGVQGQGGQLGEEFGGHLMVHIYPVSELEPEPDPEKINRILIRVDSI